MTQDISSHHILEVITMKKADLLCYIFSGLGFFFLLLSSFHNIFVLFSFVLLCLSWGFFWPTDIYKRLKALSLGHTTWIIAIFYFAHAKNPYCIFNTLHLLTTLALLPLVSIIIGCFWAKRKTPETRVYILFIISILDTTAIQFLAITTVAKGL